METQEGYFAVQELTGLVWARGPARLVGDRVILDGPLEAYSLREREHIGECSLVDDLRQLTEPADVAVLVRRWGLLFHGPDSPCRDESVAEWLEAAAGIQLVIELYQRLTASIEARDPDVTEQLREFMADNDLSRKRLIRTEIDAAPLDDERVAELCLLALMNQGLGHVRDGITSSTLIEYSAERADGGIDDAIGAPGHLWQLSRCENLLGWAYLTLKQNMLEHHRVKRCADCGRSFFLAHGSQKYCDTRCQSRAREKRRPQRMPRRDKSDKRHN